MQVTRLNGQMSLSNNCQNTNSKQMLSQPNFGIKFQASGDNILEVCPNWARKVIKEVKKLNKNFDGHVQDSLYDSYSHIKENKFFEKAWKLVFKKENVPVPNNNVTKEELANTFIPGFSTVKYPIEFYSVEDGKIMKVTACDKVFCLPEKKGGYNGVRNLDDYCELISQGYKPVLDSIIKASKLTALRSRIDELSSKARETNLAKLKKSLKGKIIE